MECPWIPTFGINMRLECSLVLSHLLLPNEGVPESDRKFNTCIYEKCFCMV